MMSSIEVYQVPFQLTIVSVCRLGRGGASGSALKLLTALWLLSCSRPRSSEFRPAYLCVHHRCPCSVSGATLARPHSSKMGVGTNGFLAVFRALVRFCSPCLPHSLPGPISAPSLLPSSGVQFSKLSSVPKSLSRALILGKYR